MIPKECKRLAEVDFPIAVVSKHSAREKSIRYGHPSTLHLWWARRPLAACRAMLMALLLPDPADKYCPSHFGTQARGLLGKITGKIGPTDLDLRGALLRFIGDLADWDSSCNSTVLEIGRGLVKAAHLEEPPLVVDPFAGGGSIPLEALRLGCEAFASDLNPVACLINKVLLEDIQRLGAGLAERLRQVGAAVKAAAEQELAELYPPDTDGARPIAYLWARTVRCEAPNCGAEIPLIRSFVVRKKEKCVQALKPVIVRPKGEVPEVRFEIAESTSEKDLKGGTVSRAKAICLCCNTVVAPDRVRAQIAAQRGGAEVIFSENGQRIGGARLLAVSTLRRGQTGRYSRLPIEADYAAVWKAQQRLKEVAATKRPDGLSAIPDEPLPPIGTLGFRVQRYGMTQWGDLFTARQKVGLAALARLTHLLAQDRSDLAALAIGKLVDLSNALCTWIPERECPSAVFKLGRVKTGWDFPESVLLSDSSGSYSVCVDNLIAGVLASFASSQSGQVSQLQAQESSLPDESVSVWFTDPPYYDAIPYADLADFFLVWLKRTLPGHHLLRDPFEPTNPLSSKLQEAVQDETKKVNGKPKDREFFEATMAKAFTEGRRVLRKDGIGSVVFAHKTTEGWEALLSGMIRGGWTITGSWPIATEMGHRLRARESAALATSVHLVCRPRPEDASIGDWGLVLRELPARVRDWMDRL